MKTTCEDCGAEYDDLYRYRVCPHVGFQMHTTIVRPGKPDVVATTIEEYDAIMLEDKPQMKIEYEKEVGYKSKAYVNEEPEPDGTHLGTNKYTDAPVCVLWTGSKWIEVRPAEETQ